jgi:lipopolysaccharide export system permease protein
VSAAAAPVSILSRYAIKEVLTHLTGVLAVVLGIFLVRRFGTLLDAAAEGILPATVVFQLLGLRTIMALPSLLPVTVYLGVILGLGRLYRDEEVTAMRGCGVAPRHIRRPIVAFSVGAAVVVGILSFSVRPWAGGRFEHIRDHATTTMEMGRMSPGRFYEIDGDADEQIVFAEGRSATDPGMLEHVFVQQRDGDRLSVLVASRALEHRDVDGGSRVLRLLDGHRYDIDPDGGDYQITRYGEFMIRTNLSIAPAGEEPEETRPTRALLASRDPRASAELQWRLAMPVSTVLLALIALPLSPVNPRQGKYSRLFTGILVYMGYRQLLGAAKNWVADGTLPGLPGLWVIHALAALTALVLVAWEGEWAYRRSGRPANRTPRAGVTTPEDLR